MIASGVLFGLGGGMQEMVFSCIQEMVPNRRRFITLGQPNPLFCFYYIIYTLLFRRAMGILKVRLWLP